MALKDGEFIYLVDGQRYIAKWHTPEVVVAFVEPDGTTATREGGSGIYVPQIVREAD